MWICHWFVYDYDDDYDCDYDYDCDDDYEHG